MGYNWKFIFCILFFSGSYWFITDIIALFNVASHRDSGHLGWAKTTDSERNDILVFSFKKDFLCGCLAFPFGYKLNTDWNTMTLTTLLSLPVIYKWYLNSTPSTTTALGPSSAWIQMNSSPLGSEAGSRSRSPESAENITDSGSFSYIFGTQKSLCTVLAPSDPLRQEKRLPIRILKMLTHSHILHPEYLQPLSSAPVSIEVRQCIPFQTILECM